MRNLVFLFDSYQLSEFNDVTTDYFYVKVHLSF